MSPLARPFLGVARAWRGLAALFNRREDGLSLAMVRIVVGGTVAAHIVHQRTTGAAALVWYDDKFGGLRNVSHAWLTPFGGATPHNVDLVCYATIASALLLATGTLTRVAALATWAGWGVLANLNGHAGGSYDELLSNLLFLLVLADAGARLSIDAVSRGPLVPPRLVPAWPRWLMVFQLVVMYTSTGFQKVSDHWVPWGSHDALWYILQQPTWQRIPMDWAAPLLPLLKAATVGSWLFEVGAPLLLLAWYYRATRTRGGRLRALFNRIDYRGIVLTFGFFMHVGIEASMEVGAFFPATMALYCACFSPDEWARTLRRLPFFPGALPGDPTRAGPRPA